MSLTILGRRERRSHNQSGGEEPHDRHHHSVRRCLATQHIHFLTGHVIEPKKQVIVFTDANPPAGQHFSISINGYLAAVGATKKSRR
jgi:hypothetical protein